MISGYTAADVRAAEEPLLARGVPLMQHAAFALATRVAAELGARRAGTPGGAVRGASVVLLVGSGSNGGDALHAGALLARRGAGVLAVCTSGAPHAEGLAALHGAGGRAVRVTDAVAVGAGTSAARHRDGPDPVASADPASGGGPEPMWVGDAVAEAYAADVVLDGLLGIGGRGAPRGAAELLVGLLRDLLAQDGAADGDRSRDAVGRAGQMPVTHRAPAGPLVVAVDLPSGIGVDDGTLPDGPVLPADVTVTFGGAKAGLLLPPAAGLAGSVQVVDLGLPLDEVRPTVVRLGPADLAGLWPVPRADAHKYRRGVLGVVAGTSAYPGAAVLTVQAAALSGVGMVRYVGPPAVGSAVLAARPETVVGTGRVQAWLLGPGVDPQDVEQAERASDAIDAALHDGLPAVLDAGALTIVPQALAPWLVLTPHAGELAALLSRWGEGVDRTAVEAEPLRWARRAHEISGATVLVKGPVTVVVGAQGAVYSQAEAPAWLATAGAGDVLAGVLGALLAGCAEEVLADPTLAAALAATAASVHGRAAVTAVPGGPVTALAVAQALPATIAAVLRG